MKSPGRSIPRSRQAARVRSRASTRCLVVRRSKESKADGAAAAGVAAGAIAAADASNQASERPSATIEPRVNEACLARRRRPFDRRGRSSRDSASSLRVRTVKARARRGLMPERYFEIPPGRAAEGATGARVDAGRTVGAVPSTPANETRGVAVVPARRTRPRPVRAATHPTREVHPARPAGPDRSPRSTTRRPASRPAEAGGGQSITVDTGDRCSASSITPISVCVSQGL